MFNFYFYLFIYFGYSTTVLVSKLNPATLRRHNLQERISEQIYQQDLRLVCSAASSAAEAHGHCR
jgi:hypothetical protein